MRVLFVVPYVPNLIRVRPYNLIRYLTKLGHEVTVVTLQSNPQEAEEVARLKEEGYQVVAFDLPRWRSFWNGLLALPSSRPLQSVYCWQPQMAKELMALGGGSSQFDVIHV